ncbi:MAG TPA: T9SS type A sorting domain-containing protein [Chitinophagales bacterium]|nr:T9SS type A sorting domain-containing protein [Chitinophagales bacterium]
MKKVFFCFFLALSALGTSAQTYIVPNAQIQPQWAMPLWFESADGQKDTLYFCYDEEAAFASDTLFGEKIMKVDPDKFNMFFESPLDNDSMRLKVTVMQDDILPYGLAILSAHALLPLVIRWDRNLFYSDSLPFPSLNPAPKAQGEMYYDSPLETENCQPSFSILMTDTVSVLYFQCYKTDSIVFTGSGVSYLVFSVHTWIGYISGIGNVKTNDAIQLFPNPATKDLTIYNNESKQTYGQIGDLSNRIIARGRLKYGATTIDVSSFSSGCYFFDAKTHRTNQNTIFIKQ